MLGFIVAVAAASGLHASDYYLDCSTGRDGNDGRSPATAWRSVARANQQVYGPGDRVLLRRGCTWAGEGFKARGRGTVAAPILLADYGSRELPRPILDGVGAHEPALLLQNVQNWIVRNLELTQHGQTPQALDPNNEKGKDADQYSDEYMRAVVHVLGLGPPNNPNCGEDCAVRNIRLENLLVRDGSWNGIYASGGYYQIRTATYGVVDNLVIDGVESRQNHKAGVEITCTYYQTRIYAASNVMVLNSHLHDNGGDGVMAGPVRNAWLEGNNCHHNGRLRNARVGCWTWDSENTVIQFNESHHNMTPLSNNKARDVAGFDLDLGTENGLLQYNWSHDNQGEGFLLLAWPIGFGFDRGESHNLQMRYNVSERDGKKLGGGITIFGGVAPAVIHNNLIYYEPDRLAGTDMFNGEGGVITSSVFGKSGKPDVRVYNNIFITNGRARPGATSNNLWSDGNGTFAFDQNVWWRVEGSVRFQWGGTVLSTWSGWQGNGFDAHGINGDPMLRGPAGGGPSAYLSTAASPGIDRGRVVTDGWSGMGDQDGIGATIPQGGGFDIGAFEKRVVTPDPGAARLLRVWQPDGFAWRVELSGRPRHRYRIESSWDLRVWATAGWAVESGSGLYQFTDRGNGPSRFYRSVVQGIPGL